LHKWYTLQHDLMDQGGSEKDEQVILVPCSSHVSLTDLTLFVRAIENGVVSWYRKHFGKRLLSCAYKISSSLKGFFKFSFYFLNIIYEDTSKNFEWWVSGHRLNRRQLINQFISCYNQFIYEHNYLLYIISLAEANVECTHVYIFVIYYTCTIDNRPQKYIYNLNYLRSS